MGSHFTMPLQMSNVQQMAAWASIENINLIESEALRLRTTIEKVMDLCAAFYDKKAAITTDAKLSPAGIAGAIKRAGDDGAERVKQLCDTFMNELQNRAASLSAKLTNSVDQKAGDFDVITLSLVQERRAFLINMDVLDRQMFYQQLCASGEDALTAVAFETAPPFLKLITPEQIEIGKAQRAAFANPEADKELTQVREQYTFLAQTRNSALKEMTGTDGTLEEQTRTQIPVNLDQDDNDQIDD